MAAAASVDPDGSADPELRPDRARADLHSLRAADPRLDALSSHVQGRWQLNSPKIGPNMGPKN